MGQLPEQYQGLKGQLRLISHRTHDGALLLASAVSSWLPHLPKKNLRGFATYSTLVTSYAVTAGQFDQALQQFSFEAPLQQDSCDVTNELSLKKWDHSVNLNGENRMIVLVPNRITPSSGETETNPSWVAVTPNLNAKGDFIEEVKALIKKSTRLNNPSPDFNPFALEIPQSMADLFMRDLNNFIKDRESIPGTQTTKRDIEIFISMWFTDNNIPSAQAVDLHLSGGVDCKIPSAVEMPKPGSAAQSVDQGGNTPSGKTITADNTSWISIDGKPIIYWDSNGVERTLSYPTVGGTIFNQSNSTVQHLDKGNGTTQTILIRKDGAMAVYECMPGGVPRWVILPPSMQNNDQKPECVGKSLATPINAVTETTTDNLANNIMTAGLLAAGVGFVGFNVLRLFSKTKNKTKTLVTLSEVTLGQLISYIVINMTNPPDVSREIPDFRLGLLFLLFILPFDYGLIRPAMKRRMKKS